MGNSAVSLKAMHRISTPMIVILVLVLCVSLLISRFWWIVLLAGSILTAASFLMQKTKTVTLWHTPAGEGGKTDMTGSPFLIPKNWDPKEIGIQIRKLQGSAHLMNVFVDSVLTRLVIGQDTKTAKTRIEFLKSKLEELNLSKELQSSLDQLNFRELNLEIQELELGQKKSTLQMEAERQKEVFELERQRDALKLKLEIAQLKKQMDEVGSPAKSAPTRSPEEIKKENKEKKQQEIRNCEREIEEVEKDTSLSENGRRRQVNILSRKLDHLYEELEKYA
jgi:hypothetical protein